MLWVQWFTVQFIEKELSQICVETLKFQNVCHSRPILIPPSFPSLNWPTSEFSFVRVSIFLIIFLHFEVIIVSIYNTNISFPFTWYFNTFCNPILVFSPITFINNRITVLKVPQKDTDNIIKHSINIKNIVNCIPRLFL